MKRIIIIALISFMGIISCKKEKTKDIKNDTNQLNLEPEIEFIFPDTTYLNKDSFGVINYKGKELDTFNIDFHSKLEQNGKVRLIFFQSTYTKIIEEKLSFNDKVIDTFVASSNNKISIRNVKFTETGLNYIDGLLTDEVYITLENKDIRIITKEYRITKKVIVLDSTLVNNSNVKAPVIGTI